MCLPNFIKFYQCLSKMLKNQNVADRQTAGMNERENGIPPHPHTHTQTEFAGGITTKLCINSM